MTERQELRPTVERPWRMVVVKVSNGEAAHLAALGLGKRPLRTEPKPGESDDKGLPVARMEGVV